MRSLCVSWYLASYCWIASTLAAENTNNQFSEPDGSLNDFDQTYTVGDTLNIKWRAGWWGSVSQPDNVDLFICWYKSDSFSTLLIANTTTKQAGFLPWKINVTDDVVKADNQFVLRFRPHRAPAEYNNAGPMAPSRGFHIKLGAVSSSSSASSTVTSTTASTLVSPGTASTTSTPSPSSEKSSAPVGPIVGGVLGTLTIIVLIVIAFLLLRISKKKKEKAEAAAAAVGPVDFNYRSMDTAPLYEDKKYTSVTEVPTTPPPTNHDAAVELDATQRISELGVQDKN